MTSKPCPRARSVPAFSRQLDEEGELCVAIMTWAGSIPARCSAPNTTSNPGKKRVDAILRLVSDDSRRLVGTDELRRAIEDLGPGVYDELGYYERWIVAITQVLLEKGVIGVDELGRRMESVKARRREAR